MENCKLSLILPVYNVENYLKPCLESLVSQNFECMEIIAVNDGSTDRSPEILKDFQSRFPEKIKIFTTENRGVSHARNYGFSKSTGKYVWFIDSDDFIAPDACSILIKKAEQDENDLVLFSHYEENQKTGEAAVSACPCKTQNFSVKEHPEQLALFSPYPWDKLIKRNLFEGLFFPEGIRFEDLPVAFLLMTKAVSIGYVEKPLYTYRKRIGFLSGLTEGTTDIFKASDFLRETLNEQGFLSLYEKELEYITVKHFLFRFRQIITNYEKGKKELKCRLINSSFDYLEKYYPNWKENPYLSTLLNDYIYRMLFLYTSRKKMLHLVNICDGKPKYFQKLYVVTQKKLHPKGGVPKK